MFEQRSLLKVSVRLFLSIGLLKIYTKFFKLSLNYKLVIIFFIHQKKKQFIHKQNFKMIIKKTEINNP